MTDAVQRALHAGQYAVPLPHLTPHLCCPATAFPVLSCAIATAAATVAVAATAAAAAAVACYNTSSCGSAGVHLIRTVRSTCRRLAPSSRYFPVPQHTGRGELLTNHGISRPYEAAAPSLHLAPCIATCPGGMFLYRLRGVVQVQVRQRRQYGVEKLQAGAVGGSGEKLRRQHSIAV